MTRARIFFGLALLLINAPIFWRSITDSSTAGGWFIASALGCALAAAALYPRRWTEE